jgi:hypothetical protein
MVNKWVPRQMPMLHKLTLDGTIRDFRRGRKRIGELGINPQVEPGCLLEFVLARFSPPSKDERFCETKTRLAA